MDGVRQQKFDRRQVNLADDLERTISLSSTTAEVGDKWMESEWTSSLDIDDIDDIDDI